MIALRLVRLSVCGLTVAGALAGCGKPPTEGSRPVHIAAPPPAVSAPSPATEGPGTGTGDAPAAAATEHREASMKFELQFGRPPTNANELKRLEAVGKQAAQPVKK